MAHSRSTTTLNDLPNEIICLIAEKLQAPVLNTMARTCRRYNELIEPFLYSTIYIQDLLDRKSFLTALKSHRERHNLVKEMTINYVHNESPKEGFSDFCLANSMPNLKNLHIHSPYIEPSNPMTQEIIEFQADVQKGVALSRLRNCTIWLEDGNGEFVGGKAAELLFRIARQPNLESMTIRNVEIAGRKPQDWSSEPLGLLVNEASEEHNRSCLTALRIFGFDMDPGSIQWCLWKLDSLKILEIRLSEDEYPPPENISYSCARWVEDIRPVASTLEHLAITGPLSCDRAPEWDDFQKLRSLQVQSDWFRDSTCSVVGLEPESDPSALFPPNIEHLELQEVTSKDDIFRLLSRLVKCRTNSRPRLSKFTLQLLENEELPEYFTTACEEADIQLQSVLLPRKHYFWET